MPCYRPIGSKGNADRMRRLIGKSMARLQTGLVALALAVCLVAPLSVAAEKPVTVFAAASLKTALDAAAAAWEEESGTGMRIAYAASSSLARQISHGAPADVFISANSQWMDYLAKKDLIEPESRRALFSNTLVLIAPAESAASLTLGPAVDLNALLGNGRLAVANIAAVPAGQYAKQALDHLGLWRQVEGRLAQAQDVRGALALVARGEVPAGVVYGSDAQAEPAVRVLATFPPESHDPIVYPAALVSPAAHPEAAVFLAYLASEDGARHFLSRGFERLR